MRFVELRSSSPLGKPPSASAPASADAGRDKAEFCYQLCHSQRTVRVVEAGTSDEPEAGKSAKLCAEMPARKLCLLLALVLILMVPVRGGAQATPYVPNLDPVYQDLDALIAVGWVSTAIAGQRPYSRLTVARLVVEARANVTRDGGFQRQRLREALGRLEGAFEPEIRALCVGEGTPCAPLTGHATLRSATADATWADSPGRRIPTSYEDLAADYLDAELNPLVQRGCPKFSWNLK